MNVVFDGHERSFFVPCGTGEKPFKWLAIAASQRYSNAAPNGLLRRRDDFCGISERAQHQAYNVELPSGDEPQPHEFISDYLHDGDEVTINLSSTQNIRGINGAPALSKWTTIAYSLSASSFPAGEEFGEEGSGLGEDANDDIDNEYDDIDDMERIAAQMAAENVATLKADARFMRLVLQSQMINEKRAAHELDTTWGTINSSVPQLNPADVSKVKEVFSVNWDLIKELFGHYAPSGNMSEEEFATFMDEAEMFLVVDAATQISKVYSRTCKYTNKDAGSFNFGSLLVALILCAQIKYNDTLNASSPTRSAASRTGGGPPGAAAGATGGSSVAFRDSGVRRSYDALYDLFQNNFIPLAEHLCLKSVLKTEFTSDLVMAKARGLYEDLLTLFNKYAFKTRDVAYTLPCEDVGEVFHKSGLVDRADDMAFIRNLFQEVQNGTIFGRETQPNPDDEYPRDEFAFPEFLEASARAGFLRFHGKEMRAADLPFEVEDNGDEGIMFTTAECLVKGLECVVNSVNAKPPTADAGKGRKGKGGGSKPSTAQSSASRK